MDFSDVSERLVETAQELASAMGGRVVLLHVREYMQGEFLPEFAGMPGYTPMPVMIPRAVVNERERLQAFVDRWPGFAQKMEAVVVEGPIVSSILDTANARKADLIVMGSHGHGAVYHLLVGSVTAGVLKSAKCPVLVVPSAL